MDQFFDSDTHQRAFGRHVTGQAEFIRIYMQEMEPKEFYHIFMKLWFRILDGIEDYTYSELPFCHLVSCRHGHHRSQAVACLLQRLIWRHWPRVDVKVLHMDDYKDRKTKDMLADDTLRSKFVSGLRNALSPPPYYVPLHREATYADMNR